MAENQVYLIKSGSNSFVEETEAIVGISGGKVGIGTTVPEADFHVAGDTQIDGDLTVKGNFTTVESTTIQVDDKNIELGVGSTTDAAADGGGITLHGTTNKTFNWVDATDAWTSSEHLHLAAGKRFAADDVRALGAGGLSIGDDAGNGIFVQDGGKVGIGTTNPGYDLDVNGSGNFDSLYIQGNSVLTGDGSIFGKWEDGATAGEIYYNGGNIGAGVVDPSAQLHVVGTTLLNGDVSASTIKAIDAGGLTLGDDAGNGIFVEDGGQIGINTTSPNYNLHVNGSTHVGGEFSVGSEFKISAGGAIGGTAPASDGDIIKWDDANNKWVAGANLGGGGGGGVGEVPAATINSLPSGQSIYEIEFAETYNVEPRIATQLEIDGEGSIIPYVVSGVSTSGYHLIFAQDIPNNNYRIHTTFGGRDVHWETGAGASLYYNDGDVNIQRNFTIGGNLTVNGTTTTVNTETVEIEDHNLVIAANTGYNQLTSEYPGAGGAYAGILWGTGDAGAASPVSLTYQTNKGFAFEGGNVGIGTTNPAAALHIKASSLGQEGLIVENSVGNQTAHIGHLTDGTAYFKLADETGQNHTLLRDNGNSYLNALDGNVGIGTTNPDAGLHVFSSGNGELEVERSSGAKINLQAQSAFAAIGTESNHDFGIKANSAVVMRLTTSGRVGIGTTNPGAKLFVKGNQTDEAQITISADNTSGAKDAILFLNATRGLNNAGSNAEIRATHDGGSGLGKMLFGTRQPPGTGAPTTAMAIDSAGNVGIGTTNPGGSLHVNTVSLSIGNVTVTNSGTGVTGGTDLNTKISNGDRIKINNEIFTVSNVAATTLTLSDTPSTAGTYTAYTDNNGLVVTSAGNVGIGTTNPAAALHIKASSLGQEGLIVENSVGNQTAHIGHLTDGTAYFKLADETGQNHTLLRDNGNSYLNALDGNVGIGTTNPSVKLDIQGSSNTSSKLTLTRTDVGRTAVLSANADSPACPFVGSQSNNDFAIYTNNSAKMLIDTNGNVGIGTTSPSEALHVAGSIQLNNWVKAIGDMILLADHDNNSENSSIRFNIDGTDLSNEKMRITSAGNVGIGTTNPTSPLSIKSTGSEGIEFQRSSTDIGSIHFSNNDLNFSATASVRFSNPADEKYSFVGGNVGIGTASPSVALDVVGSIEYTGTITDVSDQRKKENIQDLQNSLSKICQLNGKSYEMIDDNQGEEGTELGFIAQEVQQVFPEIVKIVERQESEDGETQEYLGVSYVQLIAPLVESIKEQQSIIEQLQSQNASLESRISALES